MDGTGECGEIAESEHIKRKTKRMASRPELSWRR